MSWSNLAVFFDYFRFTKTISRISFNLVQNSQS